MWSICVCDLAYWVVNKVTSSYRGFSWFCRSRVADEVAFEFIAVAVSDRPVARLVPGSNTEVIKELKLEVNNITLDYKTNVLQTILKSYGDDCQRIVILTETNYKARIIEDPDLVLTEPETYIEITSIHDGLNLNQQKCLMEKFLNNEIKIIAITYYLMDYFIKMYSKIEVNKALSYDTPQNFHQYCLLKSACGLKIIKEVGVIIDPESDIDFMNVQMLKSFLKKDGKVLPDYFKPEHRQ